MGVIGYLNVAIANMRTFNFTWWIAFGGYRKPSNIAPVLPNLSKPRLLDNAIFKGDGTPYCLSTLILSFTKNMRKLRYECFVGCHMRIPSHRSFWSLRHTGGAPCSLRAVGSFLSPFLG